MPGTSLRGVVVVDAQEHLQHPRDRRHHQRREQRVAEAVDADRVRRDRAGRLDHQRVGDQRQQQRDHQRPGDRQRRDQRRHHGVDHRDEQGGDQGAPEPVHLDAGHQPRREEERQRGDQQPEHQADRVRAQGRGVDAERGGVHGATVCRGRARTAGPRRLHPGDRRARGPARGAAP
jgi:hypothetical protein